MSKLNIRMPSKDVQQLKPNLALIGVGGAGGNAVNNAVETSLQGVSLFVANTDAQSLEAARVPDNHKIQLGTEITSGLGAGAKPEIGRMAAEESIDDVMAHLDGSHMVFIAAGMGGGTGTGAASVIAKACRDHDILTVGVVTKPFHFEGTHRMKMAEEGIKEMQEYVDTLIVIPNQNLFRIANEKTTFAQAFKMADSVLQGAVRGLTDLIVSPGLINLDFADIRSIMLEMGKAVMGTGEAGGERRAFDAAEKAISNPLLDDMSMKGAKGVIINVAGGHDMTLFEADEACNRIREEVDPDANIIFGTSFDENMEGVMRVSIVATGIDKQDMANTGTSNGYRTATSPIKRTRIINPMSGGPNGGTSMPKPHGNVQTQPGTAKDLFGQQTVPSQHQVQPQRQVAAQMSYSTPRAKTYNDAFIPPAPAEAAQYAEEHRDTNISYTQMQQGVPTPAQHTPQPQHIETVEMAQPALEPAYKPQVVQERSDQNEQPPKRQSAQKRALNLFERIKDGIKSTMQDDEAHQNQPRKAPQVTISGNTRSPATAVAAAAAPSRPAQAEQPTPSRKPRSIEDELDIPAFLRRQTN